MSGRNPPKNFQEILGEDNKRSYLTICIIGYNGIFVIEIEQGTQHTQGTERTPSNQKAKTQR